MATRYDSYTKVLGDLSETIKKSKVLVVGAGEDIRTILTTIGGIGCELLKNLVLSGFEDIEIVRVNACP